MVQRGKDHLGAVCVVAAHLAERAWTVMDRGTPYVVCDTDGTPVTPAQAKQIIAEQLDRARGGPPAAAQQEGEGPSTSPARTCAWRSRRNEATLPLAGQSWPATHPRQADPASTLTAKPP